MLYTSHMMIHILVNRFQLSTSSDMSRFAVCDTGDKVIFEWRDVEVLPWKEIDAGSKTRNEALLSMQVIFEESGDITFVYKKVPDQGKLSNIPGDWKIELKDSYERVSVEDQLRLALWSSLVHRISGTIRPRSGNHSVCPVS